MCKNTDYFSDIFIKVIKICKLSFLKLHTMGNTENIFEVSWKQTSEYQNCSQVISSELQPALLPDK